MKNASVATKLVLSFSALLLILLGTSSYIFYNKNTLDVLSAQSEHTYNVLRDINEVMSAMVNQESGFRGYLVTANTANLDPYKAGRTRFVTAYDDLKMLTSDNPAQQQRLQKIDILANDWRTHVGERGIALMGSVATQDQARDLERSGAGKEAMDGLRAAVKEMANAELSLLAERNRMRDMASTAITTAFEISIGLSLLSAIAACFYLTGAIAKPLRTLVTAMRRMSQGDLQVDIASTDRKDEIGVVAQTLETFRASLLEGEHLRIAAQEAEKTAAENMVRARHQIADQFEAKMGAIATAFAKSSSEVSEASRNLAATAEETSRQAQAVSGAAEEASANVQTVAASTEEMTASVREIASQVAKSAAVANTAAAEAARTENDVRALSEAATKIGEVVELINNIAGQTNLLALNATIEAARAGEAGKGFAVVASEVKQLADQTAKATGEISSKINEIQQATNRTVGSIERIVNTVSDIQSISTMISAAIEEQGAATGEIASNTQLAARGTEQVSDNISGVGRAAEMTGSASTQLMGLSDALSGQASELQREVGTFVRQIRAA